MLDIYGNPEKFSLFLDSRTGDSIWYPTEYAYHPVWGQYLTLQTTATKTLPGGSWARSSSPMMPYGCTRALPSKMTVNPLVDHVLVDWS